MDSPTAIIQGVEVVVTQNNTQLKCTQESEVDKIQTYKVRTVWGLRAMIEAQNYSGTMVNITLVNSTGASLFSWVKVRNGEGYSFDLGEVSAENGYVDRYKVVFIVQVLDKSFHVEKVSKIQFDLDLYSNK